jgi:hypothetical protein
MNINKNSKFRDYNNFCKQGETYGDPAKDAVDR